MGFLFVCLFFGREFLQNEKKSQFSFFKKFLIISNCKKWMNEGLLNLVSVTEDLQTQNGKLFLSFQSVWKE